MKNKIALVLLIIFTAVCTAGISMRSSFAEMKTYSTSRAISTGMPQVSLSEKRKNQADRTLREISRQELNKIVKEYLLKKAGQAGLNIEVKSIHYNGKILIPRREDVKYEIVPFRNFGYSGTGFLHIIFFADGKIVKKVKITAEVERKISAIFTSRPLERGETITEQDVYVEEVNVSDLPHQAVWDIEDVLGKTAKRNIQVSTLLKKNLMEIPPVIKKGDLVTILAETGGLRITTKGEAAEDGAKGEFIRVKNINSKKIVGGQVLREGVVKIEF